MKSIRSFLICSIFTTSLLSMENEWNLFDGEKQLTPSTIDNFSYSSLANVNELDIIYGEIKESEQEELFHFINEHADLQIPQTKNINHNETIDSGDNEIFSVDTFIQAAQITTVALTNSEKEKNETKSPQQHKRSTKHRKKTKQTSKKTSPNKNVDERSAFCLGCLFKKLPSADSLMSLEEFNKANFKKEISDHFRAEPDHNITIFICTCFMPLSSKDLLVKHIKKFHVLDNLTISSDQQ